ncbi:steroid 17-alpha-hydroxylase/17,20 lyase-like [Clytia hemisphaerica]|uniref:Uncharacterized protein n=1 Tax=Clytia hemisphaerica TaxID=252671 RepID=A0A7M5X3Q6_9CNID
MIFAILLSIPGLVLLWILITYVDQLISLRKYPSGPFPLPLIGNLLVLSEKPYLDFIELGKVYRDVFSVSFGMNRVVVLNSYDVIKEALITRGSDFAGRPSTSTQSRITSKNFQSLGHKDFSKSWTFLRKLSHRSLNIHGVKKLEDIITEDVDQMCSTLTREVGNPILIDSYIGNSLVNTICRLCFSKKYDVGDTEFAQILNFFHLINDGLTPGQPIAIFPWLRFFPDTEKFKNLKLGSKLRHDYTHKSFNEHIETFNPERIRDLTDNLLHLSQNKEMWKDAGFENVTQEQLEYVVNSIFFASVETQASTFKWLVLYMLHHLQYQTKIYEEIRSKIGFKRQITPHDKELLPFTNAVLLETQRLGSVGPLCLPHKTTTNTSVSGLTIPKGTTIFMNLYNVHRDPTYWDEPENFNPQRWLNADDGSLKKEKPTHYLPFSAGPRVCLAEKMAKMQLFMLATNFFKNFEVSLAPGEKLPNPKDGKYGETLNPPQYKVVLTQRKQN